MNRWLRLALILVAIAVAVVILFVWVFPWVEDLQQDPTVGVAQFVRSAR